MCAMKRRLAVFGFVSTVLSTALSGQTPASAGAGQNSLQPLSEQMLAALPSTTASPTASEVTVRWSFQPPPPTGAALQIGAVATDSQVLPGNEFGVTARRSVNSTGVRERDPQLAPDEIVIVTVGADGEASGWLHVKDPRLLRAESPGADGVLRGQTFYRQVTEFNVIVPDGDRATALRFYQPQWTGQAFTLVPLGTVAVNPQ